MKPLQSLFVLLLALAMGVVAAQWLGADDLNRFGEVTLRYGGYDYHSNLPKVALLAVITVLVLWLLWSLIAAPFRAWGRYRRKQGRVRLIDGLQAYEHGQWQRAEKLLDGAAKDPEVSAVALANAVRSAQARADGPAGEALLQRLGESDATLQALLRARRREEFVAAVRTLDRLLISGFYVVPLYYLPDTWLAHARDVVLSGRQPSYFLANETLARLSAPAAAN